MIIKHRFPHMVDRDFGFLIGEKVFEKEYMDTHATMDPRFIIGRNQSAKRSSENITRVASGCDETGVLDTAITYDTIRSDGFGKQVLEQGMIMVEADAKEYLLRILADRMVAIGKAG
jgi:hypothetical protein